MFKLKLLLCGLLICSTVWAINITQTNDTIIVDLSDEKLSANEAVIKLQLFYATRQSQPVLTIFENVDLSKASHIKIMKKLEPVLINGFSMSQIPNKFTLLVNDSGTNSIVRRLTSVMHAREQEILTESLETLGYGCDVYQFSA